MPPIDNAQEPVQSSSSQQSSVPHKKTSLLSSSPTLTWLSTPAPIRRLFASFPLRILPENPLPASRDLSYQSFTANPRREHTLYTFTTLIDARYDEPSFNPTCLKWQTWLLIHGVQFRIIPSSNHASPSGALPFLLPAESTPGSGSVVDTYRVGKEGNSSDKPVPARGIPAWTVENGSDVGYHRNLSPVQNMREEVYLSLVEHKIRAGWLHTVYFTQNFHTIVYPLYVAPCSSALPVRTTLAWTLRAAARTSLYQLLPRMWPSSEASYLDLFLPAFQEGASEEEVKMLYKGTADAFEALSTLLGENEWYFGAAAPGLLDVSVFAYTHLLLDDELGNGWADTRLRRGLTGHENLVKHRRRLYKRCYR